MRALSTGDTTMDRSGGARFLPAGDDIAWKLLGSTCWDEPGSLPTPTHAHPGQDVSVLPRTALLFLVLDHIQFVTSLERVWCWIAEGDRGPQDGDVGRTHAFRLPTHPAGRAWGWQEGPPRAVGLACGSVGRTVRGGGPGQALVADPRWSHPACSWRAPLSWEGGLN